MLKLKRFKVERRPLVFSAPSKPGQSPRGTTTAKDDDVAPGYNPNTGRFEKPDGTPEDSYTPPTRQEINKIFNLDKDGKKKSFIERFNEKKRIKNQQYLKGIRGQKI